MIGLGMAWHAVVYSKFHNFHRIQTQAIIHYITPITQPFAQENKFLELYFE
jgi:hypothetical protein